MPSSHPVPSWYVDSVALIHREGEGGGEICVRESEKRVGGKEFTVQLARDNGRRPSSITEGMTGDNDVFHFVHVEFSEHQNTRSLFSAELDGKLK